MIARGGGYGPGTPRAGWDHATPYLQQIFGAVFGADLTVVEAELTLASVVPADGVAGPARPSGCASGRASWPRRRAGRWRERVAVAA